MESGQKIAIHWENYRLIWLNLAKDTSTHTKRIFVTHSESNVVKIGPINVQCSSFVDPGQLLSISVASL